MLTFVKFFLENFKFTLVLSLFVLIFGITGLMQLNSESFPPVDFAMATVTTSYDGASAEDIETKITKPIEDEIRTVSGIKDVRSVSQPGLSKIFIRADIDNVVVARVMADLQRSIDRVTDLPSDLKDPPKFQEIKSEEFPVIELAVIGSNQDRKRDIVADDLKEELEDNKSILSVRKVGARERQFDVILKAQALKKYHIGINEILEKIESRNVNVPGGHLEQENFQQLLRVEGKVQNVEELRNLPIRSNFSGQTITLGMVAEVKDSEQEAIVYAYSNGKPATLLIVTKKGGADTLKLVEDIDKKIASYQSKYGKDYEFSVFNNEALRVKNRLEVLKSNAVSGLILVIVFLFIFLPGRVGVMASLSLPLAVLVTLGFMPVFGMNLNAITILALVIALGMLVDNSVVISENFVRLRKEGENAVDAALNSISQLWLPITATALTTIAAFLPMLVTKGIMGEFIKFIPIVVTISLVASLLEGFVFLPMRLQWAGKNFSEKEKGEDWFDKYLAGRFSNLVRFAVKRKYLSLICFTVLLVFSVLMLTVGNKFILFPPDQTEIYVGRVELPSGTRLESTGEYVEKLSKEVQAQSGSFFTDIIARSGVSQVSPNDPQAKEANNVGLLTLYATEETKNNISHHEVLEKLRAISVPEGFEVNWEALVNGPPVGEPVNATFRSNQREHLAQVVSLVMDKLKATEGVTNVQVDDVVGDDEIYLDLNPRMTSQLGLDVRQVGNTVRTAFSGKRVSNVNLLNKEVDIFVKLEESGRRHLEDLKKLSVMDIRGNLIPIEGISRFKQQTGTPHIKRYDFKRSKTVTANVVEGKMTAIAANAIVKETFEGLSNEYKDVSLVFGGEQESTNESMESLWGALVLSLIGIFALLVFLFRSYLRPFVIMSTIPLGLVGFSIAFAVHQRPVSFLSLIGIIGLGGIIVNSGIVLISFIDSLKEESNEDLETILVSASTLRLRAVVVSSLTTVFGLFPTAYGIGGSDAILIPMTLAMAWGLTSGTLLTLLWVPVAYALVEDFSNWTHKWFGRLKARLGLEKEQGREAIVR